MTPSASQGSHTGKGPEYMQAPLAPASMHNYALGIGQSAWLSNGMELV